MKTTTTPVAIETLCVHAGGEPDATTGAIASPLHLSTTFEHGPSGERIGGHEYSRESNPTQDRFEAALVALEGGAAALAYASGMAAIHGVLGALPPASHVLLPRDVYHGVRVLAREVLSEKGIVAEAVDMTNVDAVRAALRPETRCVWIETPSNPLLDVVDIAAVAAIAREAGALVAVDNTFATPMLQRPLALGADIVMHSTTKYFGGHSDVMGGALVFAARDDRHAAIEMRRRLQGGVMAPFNAWLTLRGLRSLAARMQMHCRNARALAEFLSTHPAIATVRWPGLASHPGHAIAARQMRDFGGMMSVQFRGGEAAALRCASRLRVFTNATSLGGCESLVEHRASVEGRPAHSPADLLRLSVGVEHGDDLVADFAQALAD